MMLPEYPGTHPTGFELVPEIPNGWSILPIKRIARIVYGIGEPPGYVDDGIPLIRATNVTRGKITKPGLVRVNPKDIPQTRIVWLKPGDIIVVRSGAYTGDSAIITKEWAGSIAGFDMVVSPTGVRPEFLAYAFLSWYLKEGQIDLEKMRAAQPHLNAEELGSCLCILPSKEEQQWIVAFLDRETAQIDALIAEQRILIEGLREKRQAVSHNFVTKGLGPGCPLKESGIEWIGPIPSHWCVTPLRHWIHVIEQGWSPEAENRAAEADEWGVVKAGCCNGGEFSSEENKALPKAIDPILALEIKSGDLLMSRASGSEDLIGSTAIVQNEVRPYLMLSDKMYRIRINNEKAHTHYLALALQSPLGRAQIKSVISGAPGLAKNISQSDVRSLIFPMPPLDEQCAIALSWNQLSTAILGLITEAEKCITFLQEHRSALITAVVTGKVDVREVACV